VTVAARSFDADRIVVIGCTGSGKSTLAVRWAWSTWDDRHRELADLRQKAVAGQATLVSLTTPGGVTAWLERRMDPGWSVLRPAKP
jgi:GTPase SAR1 family protein